MQNLGVEVGHDVLDAGVILEAVAGEILAVSRALVSTVRHLCHQWNMAVDLELISRLLLNPNSTNYETPFDFRKTIATSFR